MYLINDIKIYLGGLSGRLKMALWIFVLMAFLQVFLANERPVYCKIEGKSEWPLIKGLLADAGIITWKYQNTNWLSANTSYRINTLIPYSYYSMDSRNSKFVSPLGKQDIDSWTKRHWLGTDQLGRDVLAGMLHGSWIALRVGFFSMLIAFILGVAIGLVAGYYGDRSIRVSVWSIIFLVPGVFFGFYYGFITRRNVYFDSNLVFQFALSLLILIAIILLFQICTVFIHRIKGYTPRKIYIPFDFMIMRGLEIYKAIPALFILLAVLSIIREERVINIILLIGILSWPSISRYLRAEILKIKSLNYIRSAKVLGFSDWYILTRHAIPNAMGPVMVVLSFGMAAAILLEASLSFLGIGLSADEVSWGSLLSEGRKYMKAWWLSLFPGLAIFFVLYTFNKLGDRLIR